MTLKLLAIVCCCHRLVQSPLSLSISYECGLRLIYIHTHPYAPFYRHVLPTLRRPHPPPCCLGRSHRSRFGPLSGAGVRTANAARRRREARNVLSLVIKPPPHTTVITLFNLHNTQVNPLLGFSLIGRRKSSRKPTQHTTPFHPFTPSAPLLLLLLLHATSSTTHLLCDDETTTLAFPVRRRVIRWG